MSDHFSAGDVEEPVDNFENYRKMLKFAPEGAKIYIPDLSDDDIQHIYRFGNEFTPNWIINALLKNGMTRFVSLVLNGRFSVSFEHWAERLPNTVHTIRLEFYCGKDHMVINYRTNYTIEQFIDEDTKEGRALLEEIRKFDVMYGLTARFIPIERDENLDQYGFPRGGRF